jgi:hypothetical protein
LVQCWSATPAKGVRFSSSAPIHATLFGSTIAWEANLVKASRRKREEVGSKPTPGTSLRRCAASAGKPTKAVRRSENREGGQKVLSRLRPTKDSRRRHESAPSAEAESEGGGSLTKEFRRAAGPSGSLQPTSAPLFGCCGLKACSERCLAR